MFTIYLRSSSISTWKQCELKFFLSYVLGFRLGANEAANSGTCLHKIMELYGRKKIALQNGATSFFDDDLNREINISEVELDWAFDAVLNYYTVVAPLQTTPFKKKSLDEIYSQCQRILADKIYSPMNCNIVDVEKFFDFEIKEDWAKYNFNVQGKVFDGYLKLRGTMDCVTKISDKHYSYNDYKSGRVRWSWEKNREKTYEDFRNDVQLRLYHYVFSIIYPEVDYWTLNLYYSKTGEVSSILFTKDDIPYTLKAIKGVFQNIVESKRPKWIKNDSALNHLCNFCEFAKNKKPGTNDSYCWFFNQILKKKPIDKIQEDAMLMESHFSYSGGGSRRLIGE